MYPLYVFETEILQITVILTFPFVLMSFATSLCILWFLFYYQINFHRVPNFKQLTTKTTSRKFVVEMATPVTEDFANFDAKLSLNNPITDYLKLMDKKMKADVIMSSDIYNECWSKISEAARKAMWKMLFDDKQKPTTRDQLDKVAELMKTHKEDACFYQAFDYNKWIVKVSDELRKRNMLEFWKNEIVEKELGPCWARDSDLFDDIEDPEPANFYKFAGCEAEWLKKSGNQYVGNAAELLQSLLLSSTDAAAKTTKTLKKISTETPLEDYKYNMYTQGEIDGDDDEAYKEIFTEAREMIWQLLFSASPLTPENSKKAAELLEQYKRDAVFYSPYDYNDWIPKVRDELFKRKYFEFWKTIIVERKLGLCWAPDLDHFDDLEDTKPDEFYKSGDALMKQHKK